MLRISFYFLFFCFVSIVCIGAGLSWYVLPNLPEIETLREIKLQTPLRVYSANNSLIAEFGEKRRIPVTIEDVPETVVQAILAAEDDRFYEHPGVDWQGIVRAAVSLIKTGEKKQGGSTITMQVAKNFFLSSEKTYIRKLNEIFLALKIEKELSKNEILELYLNKIFLGQRAYGIATAAQIYYGTDLSNLTLAQSAMLAGLPKAPSSTNPITNPEAAVQRRQYVLKRMLDVGFITQAEFEYANAAPVTADRHPARIELEASYIAEMVRSDLIERFGDDAYIKGLNVYTTILDNNQRAANLAVRKALLEYDERHGYRGAEASHELPAAASENDWQQLLTGFSVISELFPALVTSVEEKSIRIFSNEYGLIDIDWPGLSWARKYISENRRTAAPKTAADIVKPGDVIRILQAEDGSWRLSQIPVVEGGLVSLDPNNGATLALVGGFDFYRSKFNRVMQAKRQPGSGFKPFIYSAALAAGETAASIINDAPVVFDDPGIAEEWRPENYGHDYKGPMRLRKALTQSRNLVSIRLLNKISVPYALEHVARFGFDTNLLPKNLSLALGSGEITPWQQASAYSVFANGGFQIEPYFIDRIEDSDGNIIFKTRPKIVCRECEQAEQESQIDAELLSLRNPEQDEQSLTDEDNKIEETMNESVEESSLEEPEHARRVVDERNIWIMNSMTRDVVQFGTGRRALSLGRKDLSGKTGTTNDQRDAWFCGFNADVVAIAWVGFDKFLPLGSRETGARAALPMWIDYMKVALDGKPDHILPKPEGLVNVRINPNTGKPARADNPDAMFEVFRAENAPEAGYANPANPFVDANPGNIEDIF